MEGKEFELFLKYSNVLKNNLNSIKVLSVLELQWKNCVYQPLKTLLKSLQEPKAEVQQKKFINHLLKVSSEYYKLLETIDQQTLLHVLLHLGDIHRYLAFHFKIDYKINLDKAKHFYHKISVLNPSKGLFWNQLSLISDNSLDSIYFSMRSLSAQEPYVGAKDSLLSFFYRVSKIDFNESLSVAQTQIIAEYDYLILQKMLFTRIDLDDFCIVFSKFKKSLSNFHVDFLNLDSQDQLNWCFKVILITIMNMNIALSQSIESVKNILTEHFIEIIHFFLNWACTKASINLKQMEGYKMCIILILEWMSLSQAPLFFDQVNDFLILKFQFSWIKLKKFLNLHTFDNLKDEPPPLDFKEIISKSFTLPEDFLLEGFKPFLNIFEPVEKSYENLLNFEEKRFYWIESDEISHARSERIFLLSMYLQKVY
jgi:hypothetical protein